MKLTRFFFLATVFSVTFEKIHWDVAGQIYLADLCAIGFIVSFAADRLAQGDSRLPRTSFVATGFLIAFLVVYLVGYFNLDTAIAAAQYGKGMTKFAIHFAFLIFGVAYLARASRTFYWQTLGFFTAGMVVNSAYGILQLLLARSGSSLDQALLSPITGGASNINIYGAVDGANVYRPNAITGDPNHLGVMLIIPLLALMPVYLRLERGHRLKTPLAVTLGFLLIVELTTLSRSGLLGLIVGLAVLALPYHRFFLTKAFLAPLAAVVGCCPSSCSRGSITSRRSSARGCRPAAARPGPLRRLRLHPGHPLHEAAVRARAQQLLGVLRAGHRQDELGAALVLRRPARGDGARRRGVFGVFVWYLFARLGAARRVGRCARRSRRRGRRARDAARLGNDGRARRDARREPLLSHDVVLLRLRVRGARARLTRRLRPWTRRGQSPRRGSASTRRATSPRRQPRDIGARRRARSGSPPAAPSPSRTSTVRPLGPHAERQALLAPDVAGDGCRAFLTGDVDGRSSSARARAGAERANSPMLVRDEYSSSVRTQIQAHAQTMLATNAGGESL